jgi:hypothetical protein
LAARVSSPTNPPIGLTALDVGHNANIRIKAFIANENNSNIVHL